LYCYHVKEYLNTPTTSDMHYKDYSSAADKLLKNSEGMIECHGDTYDTVMTAIAEDLHNILKASYTTWPWQILSEKANSYCS